VDLSTIEPPSRRAASSDLIYLSLDPCWIKKGRRYGTACVHISEAPLIAALDRLDRGGNDYINHVVKRFPLVFYKGM